MSRLMIPVQLDVLVVRQSGGRFADCGMRPPIEDEQHHRDLWAEPFTELTEGRPTGAYLHWALPDALTHGTVGENGESEFMPIPDRWLVVRTSPSSQPGKRTTRSWVLESDRGESHPADTWAETARATEGRAPLTPLGHGDPAWAAYFDNTANRLAFYDDLQGVAAGPIAYVVTGWHASTTHDPIADPRLRTRVAMHDRLAELRWSVTGARRREAAVTPPSGALYHGAAVDLPWPSAGASDEVGGPPSASSVRVVLASTTAEALATLMTDSPAEARLLEAAQLGALDEMAEPDGRTRLDAVLHAAAFGSLPGGEVLERVEQPEAPPPDDPPVRSVESIGALAATVAEGPGGFRRVHELAPRSFAAPDRERERNVMVGSFADLEATLPFDEVSPPPTGAVDVFRSLPRFFFPSDLVVLVEGARRSPKHGGDGRFTLDGTLACRVSGDTVDELSVLDPAVPRQRLSVRASQLIEAGAHNTAVPAESEDLLRELVLLDPGAADATSRNLLSDRSVPPELEAATRRRVQVEQTVWWGARDGRVDIADLASHSNLAGTVPSPLAVTPPQRPWTPVHIEWEAEYLPSENGGQDWRLDEVDLEPTNSSTRDAIVVRGRTLLTPAAAHVASCEASRTIRAALRVGSEAELPENAIARFSSEVSESLDAHIGATVAADDDGQLDLPDALSKLDVLSGTLDPLHDDLRRGTEATPPVGVRAGFVRLKRLRVVDGFGQFLDLQLPAVLGHSLRADDVPARAALPPRINAPSRLWLRYTDGKGGDAEATSNTSPVAGFLVPNHLEGALEIFDAQGMSRAVMRPRADGSAQFDASPGIASTLAPRPAEVLDNPALSGLVDALLDWGIIDSETQENEGALSALLRLVDTSRWSTDPQGHGIDESLGMLVGRPVAVLRARAWLDVADEGASIIGGFGVPLRLGSIGALQDGLYGAFVNHDYRALLVGNEAVGLARDVGRGRGYLQPAPLVAEYHRAFASDVSADGDGDHPIVHPFIARDRLVHVRPGRPVDLTLLVEPYGLVYATTGVLPRKEIGMRREWLAPGLSRLAPTFRFGPVLVDPTQVRLPVAREAHGTWSWAHRVDETTWAEDAVSSAAGKTAQVGGSVTANEGWLRFTPEEPS